MEYEYNQGAGKGGIYVTAAAADGGGGEGSEQDTLAGFLAKVAAEELSAGKAPAQPQKQARRSRACRGAPRTGGGTGAEVQGRSDAAAKAAVAAAGSGAGPAAAVPVASGARPRAADAAQGAEQGGGGDVVGDVAVSGDAVGPCGPMAPAATGHGGTEEPIGVLNFASIRTRSGRAGFAWSKVGGWPSPPRWCDRARVSAHMARTDPQAAMRAVMAHYSRWSGQELEFSFSTNEEDYGFEAMLRIDCYGERFIGRPCNTERGAEDEACKLALATHHDQGYIVWT